MAVVRPMTSEAFHGQSFHRAKPVIAEAVITIWRKPRPKTSRLRDHKREGLISSPIAKEEAQRQVPQNSDSPPVHCYVRTGSVWSYNDACHKKPGNRTQTRRLKSMIVREAAMRRMTADVIKLSRSMVLKVSLGSRSFPANNTE